jgi:hypothetical protein
VTLPTLGGFLQSNNTVTLMLGAAVSVNSNGDSRDFYHRNNSGNEPTLAFTVPEPTTLLLLLLGSIGLVGRRRRN